MQEAPRVPIWVAWTTGLVVEIARVASRYASGNAQEKTGESRETRLAIEAGPEGWKHIFHLELKQSAEEMFGQDAVIKLEVDRKRSYLWQITEFLRRHRPTHYFYDPRTASQNFLVALFQAVAIATLLARYQVTPIAYCTDISVRRWRIQVFAVTASQGLVVTLTDTRIIAGLLPHSRVLGPTLMPISWTTVRWLRANAPIHDVSATPRVVFFGSLYEPRVKKLNAIQRSLREQGIELEISGREFGGSRVSNRDYWLQQLSAEIVVTTSCQARGKGLDFSHVNHLIYRFSEALAAGACLVAESAPGVENFFQDGRDLILWDDEAESVQEIVSLVKSRSLRQNIANQGLRTFEEYAQMGRFWKDIHESLSKHGLPLLLLGGAGAGRGVIGKS